MTVRMYARLKKIPLDKTVVKLERLANGKIVREIEFKWYLSFEQRDKLFQIAKKVSNPLSFNWEAHYYI